MIRELAWRAIARIVTIPDVTDWLIELARRTPYYHIIGPDGSLYMERFWLFNPYPAMSDGGGANRGWRALLPSARIHHIMRPDTDRHLHDHPWDARTIVLRNGYREERPFKQSADADLNSLVEIVGTPDGARLVFDRQPGYTGPLLFGQYHRISYIPDGGAWTLFITWKKRGTWGFWVDGRKVPWREYLGVGEGA